MDDGPVIVQKKLAIQPGDTPDTLAARVLTLEHQAYPEAVRLIAEGRI
jgi:phosphoribosylglycinamide formyltransferase-1